LNVVSGKVKKPMGKGVIKIKCIAHMDESGWISFLAHEKVYDLHKINKKPMDRGVIKIKCIANVDESGWISFLVHEKVYDLQHPTWQTANVRDLCKRYIFADILQGTNEIVNENLNWVPSNVNRSFLSQVWIGPCRLKCE
jgi:hypothetical protein